MKLALLLALAACGRPATNDATAPAASTVIPATAKQAVIAIVPDWTSTHAELRLWQRRGDTWSAVGEPWQGVIGRTGAAWGDGLHGHGAPAGVAGPIKHEGDGKSPAGVFALTASYGYAASAPPGTALGYTPLDDNWQCVDDPHSRQYARVLDKRTVDLDWTSSEQMRRPDELYTWVVTIAHNAARTPGDGSCIFFHVWAGPESTTSGCTAMPAERLERLISSLDPSAVYVLLPRSAYEALAPSWHLPSH